MKKALQTGQVEPGRSLANRVVGNALCEARRSRSCNDSAQIFVLDSGGEARALPNEGLRRLQRRVAGAFAVRLGGFRQPSGSEPNPRDAEALRYLGRPVRQLEGPDRVRRVHVERSVTSDARRPRAPGDGFAHSVWPRLHELADPAFGSEAAQLPLDLLAEVLHRTTVPASAASTSSSWSGSTGSAVALVLVISACPYVRRRSARMRRRSGSSSERTSSSKSSGGKPRRSLTSSASARSSASTANLCSPCEPKARRSRSPARISTSSRCGPAPVAPRSKSRSSRACSVSSDDAC